MQGADIPWHAVRWRTGTGAGTYRSGEPVVSIAHFVPTMTVITSKQRPRKLTVVDEIVRSPAGKPDYRWAKDTALADL